MSKQMCERCGRHEAVHAVTEEIWNSYNRRWETRVVERVCTICKASMDARFKALAMRVMGADLDRNPFYRLYDGGRFLVWEGRLEEFLEANADDPPDADAIREMDIGDVMELGGFQIVRMADLADLEVPSLTSYEKAIVLGAIRKELRSKKRAAETMPEEWMEEIERQISALKSAERKLEESDA